MKIGLLLFLTGSALILYLMKIDFEKEVLKRIGVLVGILMLLYGLILVVQPSEDEYVKFTKTTISKEINSSK
ncbi:MAG: hypothetical protein U9Q33_06765 [Campylobacterota bacterium]|nr:hypothetical protein [Campylobacterota bacterium]